MSDILSQLLDTAARLFAESGYKAVSMRDIAKLVGVTQANLYYHFRDKADLTEATLASVFEARDQELDAWLGRHPSPDRQSVVSGKRVSVRDTLVCRSIITQKQSTA